MLGDHRLAELTTVDLATVVVAAGERARRTHPDRTGRSAEETCVAALRALSARAVVAGHLTADPAAVLAKPRRTRSRRRALDDREVAELADAVRLTSRDRGLDLLLVRFHLETGARRQGALNLRRADLDARRSTVWLREKHGDQREQPVSPSHLAALDDHHLLRAQPGTHGVFTTANGTPVTARPLRHPLCPSPDRTPLGRPDPGVRPCTPAHRHHQRRPTGRLRHRPGLRGPHPTNGHWAVHPRHACRGRRRRRSAHWRAPPARRRSSRRLGACRPSARARS